MSQLILESTNTLDLQLLLSLAKRLNVKVVAVSESVEDTVAEKMALMQQAASDPQFQTDVEKVVEDFKYIDAEIHE